MTAEGEALRDRLDSGLADAFRDTGDMVNRWVLVTEVVDSNGERALWLNANKDCKTWDILGMLHSAIMIQAEDDEDE